MPQKFVGMYFKTIYFLELTLIKICSTITFKKKYNSIFSITSAFIIMKFSSEIVIWEKVVILIKWFNFLEIA